MRRLLAVGALAVTAACGTTDAAGGDETLTVLAAASLTEPFTALGTAFEDDHPGVHVRLVFDSSATLATQLVQGAPGDVLATADERTMQQVTEEGLTAHRPRIFATNRLELVVPAGNPAGITELADLDRPGITFVACADSAPCGALAAAVLERHAIEASPSSLETDVKAVLTKVVLDEADAGLVYASDAVAARGEVETVPLPDSPRAGTAYPVAALEQSRQPDLARAWVDLMLSADGQAILADAGFGAP